MEIRTDPKMDPIICSLCSGLKDDPRIVGVCHHSFCLACIKEHCQVTTDDCGKTISTCPQCHLYFEWPEGGLESLKKNEFVIRFRERYLSSILCNVCSEGMAVHRCEECKEHYCDKCSSWHLKFKATREHKLSRIEEESNFSEYLVCQLHMREFTMFCSKCSTFVCICCLMEQHKGHKVMRISNNFEIKLGLCDAILHKDKLFQFISKQINDINSLKDSSRERAAIVKSNILSRGEKLKSLIDSQVVDLCSTLEQSLLLFQSKVDSAVEHLEYLSGSLEDGIRDYENQIRNLDFRTVTEYPDPFKEKADPVIPDFNEIFTPEFESTVGKLMLSVDSLIGSIKYAITDIDGRTTHTFDRQPKPNVSGREKKNKKNSKNLTQTTLGTSASQTLEAPTWSKSLTQTPLVTSRASQTLRAHESSNEDDYTPAFKSSEDDYTPAFKSRDGEAQVIAVQAFGTSNFPPSRLLPRPRTGQLMW